MAKASDFLPAPMHLIVPDRPLEADIYIYFQLNDSFILFRRSGDLLSDKDMAQLAKVSRNAILIPRAQWAKAMDLSVGDISMELETAVSVEEATERMNRPSVRSIARTVLVGLNSAAPEPQGATPDPKEQAELARNALSQVSPLIEKLIVNAKKNRSQQTYEQVIREWREDKNPLVSHNRQVSAVAVLILLVVGNATYEELTDIALAGMVHDLGLMNVPVSIMQRHLLGAENFNSSEKLVFMKHTDSSVDALKTHGFTLTPGAARIVQLHHENWDGSGFKGMRGAQIFRPARALRLADGVVSRLNNQGHEGGFREALSALAIEVGSSGDPIYDPELVTALIADIGPERA